MRTLIATLATLGLLSALTAVPVFAQSCNLTDDGSTTEVVTDNVELTFDSDFACTDAAEAGTWSIVVNVSNGSDVAVTIDEVTLSHATPPMGDEDVNMAVADGLPVTVAADDSGAFDVDGDYALVETDDGELVNLHLRATGSTDGDEPAPFTLGINVHMLAPGVELDDEGEDANSGGGRPDWAPGPPPWVMAMLLQLFGDEFPWHGDAFPPRGDEEEDVAEGEATVDDDGAGPPSWVNLPPHAGGGDAPGEEVEADDDDGPPDWVKPGGPPASVPGPPAGAGRGSRP